MFHMICVVWILSVLYSKSHHHKAWFFLILLNSLQFSSSPIYIPDKFLQILKLLLLRYTSKHFYVIVLAFYIRCLSLVIGWYPRTGAMPPCPQAVAVLPPLPHALRNGKSS